MKTNQLIDVIIIGGSYAGLSAAIALGRSLRRVLVIDGGEPCNRQTPHSHNFLTQDGKTPKEISKLAKQQVLQYETVQFVNGKAVTGRRMDEGFQIEISSGECFESKRLIFATGIRDLMPDIKGFSESWGISVIHCPYCHGYEYRSEKTGLLANGAKAVHLSALVHNLTKDLTLITQGKPDFTVEQIRQFERAGIEIVDTEVKELIHQHGYIERLLLKDGRQIPLKALYAAIPFEQHSEIPLSLGCSLTESGHLQVDSFQKTSVPGVYACGDNSSPMRSVASAVYTGSLAGAMVNMDLANEEFC